MPKKRFLFQLNFKCISLYRSDFNPLYGQDKTNLEEWELGVLAVVEEWCSENDTISFFTSGSTGKPKEIKFLKTQIIKSAEITGSTFGLTAGAKVLLCLPAKYVAGKMMILRAIINNWELDVVKSEKVVEIKSDVNYHFSAMVPLQAAATINNNKESFEQIEKVIIGGAKISSNLHRSLMICGNSCYATYGMTETLTHVAVQNLNGEGASKYFLALEGFELNVNQDNCLNIEAIHLGEDIIQTNDVVEFVDFGKFVWKGRVDNVINSGGVKIQPELLEKKLEEFLENRFFVYGISDEKLGEKVVLFIETNEFDKSTMKLFMDLMTDLFSKYETPKNVLFINKFDETASGKIIRKNYLSSKQKP